MYRGNNRASPKVNSGTSSVQWEPTDQHMLLNPTGNNIHF